MRRLKQCRNKSWKPPHHTPSDDLYSGQILRLPSPLTKDPDGNSFVQKHSSMRLDIPKFGGADPQQWIFNIEEYFNFHQTPENQRLQIVGTTHFEDPLAELAKLMQIGTVADFQMAFEKLLDKVTGVSESQLVSYVIGGLKLHIRRELLLAKPRSQFGGQKFLPAPHALLTPALPIRKFTAAEIRDRRDKGLCFHCDQKYSQGHRCKGRFLLLIGDEEEPDMDAELVVGEEDPTNVEFNAGDVFMLNTMTGSGNPRSLRLVGKIKHSPCLVLIDSGSTHNFINPDIVEKLKLPTKAIKPFKVYIGNGDTLGCQHVCPNVEICMRGNSFTVDLQVLSIVGPDVVLGVQWLQSLGSVTHDYTAMTMSFRMGSTPITIKGESVLNNQPISFHQLQAMATKGDIRALYEIQPINPTEPIDQVPIQPTLPTVPKPLKEVLLEFSSIFESPTQLPPHCVFYHKFHLLPNTKPVNVRLYRYPYFQKAEIENLVREMLDQGLVRPSRSPFSSPILLVLKKR
nr:Transposon Ty3-G Gag-Pol polyprotein [Ipomoea batatas]